MLIRHVIELREKTYFLGKINFRIVIFIECMVKVDKRFEFTYKIILLAKYVIDNIF